MKDRFIIWSNYHLNFYDWEKDLKAEFPDKSDDELYEIMHEINNDYLSDERINLDIQLPREIIVIADIGRWNGRVTGYKVIESGNIKDCLYSECDMTEWYVDKLGDLRCDAYHHDGTNHYLYRTFKDYVTDEQIEHLINKFYEGTVIAEDIAAVTKRLGKYIAEIYGFDL
jgi:hypothetical protein